MADLKVDKSKPPVLSVVTRWFGTWSQVWAWRQVVSFTRFQPQVISWTYENKEDYPLGRVPIRLIGTEEEPNDGPNRWKWRWKNLLSRNFFGTQGAEKDAILQILQESQPAVILCHFGHAALRLLPASQALKIPLVVHFHGLDVSSALENRWYRWSVKSQISQFAAAVCVGNHQRLRLIQLGLPPERVHLIPCGVPTQEFSPSIRSSEDSTVFICVTRLVAWKGVRHVIGAYARISNELTNSRLVIVGDGPDLPVLQDLVQQHNLGDKVEFTGSQPPRRVRELLGKADVFLQHSLNDPSGWLEGFGVSIAEASSMGLPVVVSNCGGITDQVLDGQTGLVVSQGDETAMAAAMLKLAQNPQLRARLGAAGRQRMVEHFDTQLQVEKLEKLLLRVARTDRL